MPVDERPSFKVKDFLSVCTEYLQSFSVKSPLRQAEELLCDVFSWSKAELYRQYEMLMEGDDWERCYLAMQRRAKGEPLQYIHGKVDFYGCEICVSPSVLIPRPETEILVDLICKELESQNLQNKELWDVCTGSGCIGIAIKKRFPLLRVVLSDLSAQALEVARGNAQTNGVDVEIRRGDFLEPLLQEAQQGKKIDFLVCNPPYISEEEYLSLEKEVKDYEPRQALVAGVNGLEFFERLEKEGKRILKSSGKICLEIGASQGEAVKECFQNKSWVNVRLLKDWAGHDRFFFLEKEGVLL